MFQQHQRESLSKAWTRFKDLLQKVPHHGIDLWLQVQIFYDHVNPATRGTIDQSAGGKLRDRNTKELWALLEDPALYDNESWNDPQDFAKPVKATSLPQDVPSTSDRRLIELENQVQRLMEAHLVPKQPVQVNKITSLCEICSGPHDTQYCIEILKQAFIDYTSSRIDEAEGKWYTFKPEQNNLGDTYNSSWKSYPNLRLVSNFMAYQDARLSKFEADFKQQQGDMTNKTDTVLKFSFARSYPNGRSQCQLVSTIRFNIHHNGSIIQTKKSCDDKSEEEERKEKRKSKNIGTTPPSPPDPSISFSTKKYDDSRKEELREDENAATGGLEVEYVDTFPTRSELAYHKFILDKKNLKSRSFQMTILEDDLTNIHVSLYY
ncbi:hypothetical protein Tco_0464799 [Tanacetum coccineum]